MNRIRKYYIGLIFFLTGIAAANAQWNLEKCPTTNNLNSISSDGKHSGWIVGDNGTILFKSGSEWISVKSPTSRNLYSVCITGRDEGWAVGMKGTIIHFDGREWKLSDSPVKADLFSVSFSDSKHGIASGANATILYFEDGTWRASIKEGKGDFFATACESSNAWVGGGLECVNVPILKINKSKGGTSSSAYQSYDFIYGMSFLNSEDGWAVGSPSLLLHFDGQEWERQSVDEKFSSLRSISFMDENNGISAGYGGTILLFENKLWRKDNSGISKKLNGTAVWDSTYYAVGESGTIISRTTKLHNNTTVYSNKSGGETGLQVYPNPCNDFLKFILPEDLNENPLQIIMTGIPGQIILEIKYNTSVPGGEYTLVTKPINNGFYLLNVITGDKHFINKILIKH